MAPGGGDGKMHRRCIQERNGLAGDLRGNRPLPGFVIALTLKMAIQLGDHPTAEALTAALATLAQSRLAGPDLGALDYPG